MPPPHSPLAYIVFMVAIGILINHVPSAIAQTTDPNEINAETNAQLASLLNSAPSQVPYVFRVDKLTDELVERANNAIASEKNRISFVMNGLRVTNIWQDVLYDPVSGQSDLSLMAAALLGLLPGTIGIDPYIDFLESREEVLGLSDEGGRDFTVEILDYYDAVIAEYRSSNIAGDGDLPSPQLDVAPFYQVSYGYRNATNAKTTGPFPENALPGIVGRCNIILNLGANRMLEKEYFAIATIHETWHCFHSPLDTSPIDLLKLAIREGVVTYLTSITTVVDESGGLSSFEEADLLFWSTEELEAAQDLRTEIIGAFAADRTKTDPNKLQEWLVLGKSLSNVPGAPSRSAYYIGWLAVQAYVASLSSAPSSNLSLAKDILDLNDSSEGREDIIKALLDSELSSVSGAKPHNVALWLVITQLVVPLCSLLLWS